MMAMMMVDVDAGGGDGEQCQGCCVGPDITVYSRQWRSLITEKLSLQETDNKLGSGHFTIDKVITHQSTICSEFN